jgi:hypothetical protein
MAKKGRPFVYQSEDEKPVTVSLRIPHGLYDEVERYVKIRPGMTMTEFVLDGIRLKLETPTDPRDIILSDDNTVIQELQTMVDTAVQNALILESAVLREELQAMAEVAVQRTLAQERTAPPALDTSTPAPEASAPRAADLSYNGNAVLQEEAPRRSTRRGGLKLTPQQEAALRAKRQQGTPIKALMEEYGISKATVFRYLE